MPTLFSFKQREDPEVVDRVIVALQDVTDPPGDTNRGVQGPAEVLTPLDKNLHSIETRTFVVALFAKGFTVRRIIKELTGRIGRTPDERELINLYSQYSGNIDELREEIAKRVLTTGLARAEVRIERLAELADEWAERAGKDAKSAAVYLKTLDQLREETEPLGLVPIDPEDPWLLVITELRLASPSKEIPNSKDQLTTPAPTTNK